MSATTKKAFAYSKKSRTAAGSATEAASLLLALCPRIMQTVRRSVREQSHEGLTITQQQILLYVADNPGVGLSELARHFMVSAPSASTTVNRLTRAHLLTVRTPRDNRRRIALTVTGAGQTLVGGTTAASRREVRALLASIPPDQLRILVPVLRTLLRNIT